MLRLFPTHPKDLEDLRRREEAVRRAFKEERRHLAEQAVQASNGNHTDAAARLGVNRVTLYEMLGKGKSGPAEVDGQ